MPWLTEDRERLDAFRRGDADMLSRVYDVYAKTVARALRNGFTFKSGERRLRFDGFSSPFDLDDTVQETFLRAFRDRIRTQYDGLRPYGPYVIAIARNVVIDRFRKDARAKAAFTRLEEVSAQDATADGDIANRQLSALLEAFKKTCSPNEVTLIEVRFEQHLPRARVSELTGWSAMQVRSREERLRKRLFEMLVAHGFGPDRAWVIWWVLVILGEVTR